MIVTDKFAYSKKKELQLGKEPDSVLVILYGSKNGVRLFISTEKEGDADIFLDINETNKFIELLESALLRALNEYRGFCGPVISPQSGDFDDVVNAILQVVFVDKTIGISVDVEDVQGVELWPDLTDVGKLINALREVKGK
ncbi:MAG: hypothetical protein JRI89_01285 [Deltaproteobacteria bacterium]|nr:hypothetical protein [Deltaproteobacteria bacterium]